MGTTAPTKCNRMRLRIYDRYSHAKFASFSTVENMQFAVKDIPHLSFVDVSH